MRDGAIVVVAPLPDTPAERAGIQAGDRIVEVDGKSTEHFSQDDAVRALRAPRVRTAGGHGAAFVKPEEA